MNDPFVAVCRSLGGAPDRSGWVHVACPNCGKEPKPGQRHFAFSERGGHCFVCGWGVGLGGLLRRVGGGGDVQAIVPPLPPRPRPPRPWQADPEPLVRRYASAPDSVPLWREYRPLELETMARWELGVGVLPASKCGHRRLVVPVRRQGRVVALAGRAIGCDCAKWTLAGGSEFALFNLDGVTTGCGVIVVENRADAILAMQEWPDTVAVAKGTANVWKAEWTERMVEVRPGLVLFWPDNDEVGYEGAARGANELLAAGVYADVARWAPTYPPKYDLGSLLCDLK